MRHGRVGPSPGQGPKYLDGRRRIPEHASRNSLKKLRHGLAGYGLQQFGRFCISGCGVRAQELLNLRKPGLHVLIRDWLRVGRTHGVSLNCEIVVIDFSYRP
jgi:hypothetical protein